MLVASLLFFSSGCQKTDISVVGNVLPFSHVEEMGIVIPVVIGTKVYDPYSITE